MSEHGAGDPPREGEYACHRQVSAGVSQAPGGYFPCGVYARNDVFLRQVQVLDNSIVIRAETVSDQWYLPRDDEIVKNDNLQHASRNE